MSTGSTPPYDPLGELIGYIMWQGLHGPGRPAVPLTQAQAMARAAADPRFAGKSRAELSRAADRAWENVGLTQLAMERPTELMSEWCVSRRGQDTSVVGLRVWYLFRDQYGNPQTGSVVVNATPGATISQITADIEAKVERGDIEAATLGVFPPVRLRVLDSGIAAVFCGGYSNPLYTY
jgi:hypothetical protein